jgi:hypothetical protein
MAEVGLTEEERQEIHQRGMEALERELGFVGMIRFIQIVRPGKGNYTEDRRQWLDGTTYDDDLEGSLPSNEEALNSSDNASRSTEPESVPSH